MGKFPTGIGMTDVAAMAKAIESMHDCRVELIVRTLGKDASGRMEIECAGTFNVLPGSELPKVVGVHMNWPNKAAATFDGLCYNLLWQLDYAIQKAYEQRTIDQT